MIRRFLLTLALALPLTGGFVAAASAQTLPPVTPADRSIGRADAPVTVVEYASFTCPHCAAWQTEVLPPFKTRFIDTGRVRLVFRNLPTAPANVAQAAAAVAHCAPADRFPAVAKSFFEGQAGLFAGDARTWFTNAIAAGGMTEADIETCFANPATKAELEAEAAGAAAAGVQGTPAFFVNGRRTTEHTLAALAAAIDAAGT